jgi:hypothetical protein
MPDRLGRLSTGECLEPEVLSAYIDGTLEVRERAEVEAHLADCSDCYDVLSDVLRIREEASAARPVIDAPPSGVTIVRGMFGRRKVLLGVAGGLAAAAALVLMVRLQPTWRTDGVDPKLADLVEAVGEERTVEARLTGGFKYGPLRSPVRSGGRVGPTDNWSLLAAAGRIREEAERNPTSENLYAAGVASLLIGNHDEAVRSLESANSRERGNARFQNDLAVAYLARASALGRAEDLARARDLTEHLRQSQPDFVEGAFTRAIVLDRTAGAESVRSAWHEYLSLDPSSAWAAEARARLAELGPESAPGQKP